MIFNNNLLQTYLYNKYIINFKSLNLNYNILIKKYFMRLREPLYGWRISSMHLIMHLCLLINQFVYVEFDLWDIKPDHFICPN